jgi:hypothetical protein
VIAMCGIIPSTASTAQPPRNPSIRKSMPRPKFDTHFRANVSHLIHTLLACTQRRACTQHMYHTHARTHPSLCFQSHSLAPARAPSLADTTFARLHTHPSLHSHTYSTTTPPTHKHTLTPTPRCRCLQPAVWHWRVKSKACHRCQVAAQVVSKPPHRVHLIAQVLLQLLT